MNPRAPVSARGAERYPVGPPVVPHRKNAAEWVMWVVLWPVALVARLFGRTGG